MPVVPWQAPAAGVTVRDVRGLRYRRASRGCRSRRLAAIFRGRYAGRQRRRRWRRLRRITRKRRWSLSASPKTIVAAARGPARPRARLSVAGAQHADACRPGELQRLRLATQVRSNLFGVVYVLDEPSAGLHPADTEALLTALDRLKASGNSLFVVEHDSM